MRHERVIVISPRKSGTHLIQRLLVMLGYRVWGDVAAPVADLPALSIAERIALAELVMSEEQAASLDVQRNRQEFIRLTNLAWLELARVWSYRTGASKYPQYRLSQENALCEIDITRDLWTTFFSRTPPGICWIYHSLDISAADPAFLIEWQTAKRPAIILNVRDPRDALVSLTDFLSGASKIEFSRVPEAQVFRPGYAALTDVSDRIDLALSDPCLPFFDDYDRAVSFHAHPDVCNVSFEELIGPQGGGCRTGQLAAVERVAAFLGVPEPDCQAVADALYSPASFTFNRGQTGRWRQALNERQVKEFADRHGYLIGALGYE